MSARTANASSNKTSTNKKQKQNTTQSTLIDVRAFEVGSDLVFAAEVFDVGD
jgi:hypothetical protein